MKNIKSFIIQNKVTHTFSSCQWPIGDPQAKDFHFCGDKAVKNKPYCAVHCSIAYIDEKELRKAKEIKQNKIAA